MGVTSASEKPFSSTPSTSPLIQSRTYLAPPLPHIAALLGFGANHPLQSNPVKPPRRPDLPPPSERNRIHLSRSSICLLLCRWQTQFVHTGVFPLAEGGLLNMDRMQRIMFCWTCLSAQWTWVIATRVFGWAVPLYRSVTPHKEKGWIDGCSGATSVKASCSVSWVSSSFSTF